MNLQHVFLEDRKSRREYCAPEQGEGPNKEQVEGSPIKGRVKITRMLHKKYGQRSSKTVTACLCGYYERS